MGSLAQGFSSAFPLLFDASLRAYEPGSKRFGFALHIICTVRLHKSGAIQKAIRIELYHHVIGHTLEVLFTTHYYDRLTIPHQSTPSWPLLPKQAAIAASIAGQLRF